MSNRRTLAIALSACLGLAGFWAHRLATLRHCIDREAFERIVVGMPQHEVEALLGGPAGDYVSGCVLELGSGGHDCGVFGEFAEFSEPAKRRWVSREGAIFVSFDGAGMVSRKSFREVSSLDLSNDNCLLDKLQRWVGLKNSRLWIYEWDGNWEQ